MNNNDPEIQTLPNWFAAYTGAVISVLSEAIKDPFDEIRGHLTAPILRSWITENQTAFEQSRACAVYYDRAKQKVEAFMVDEKNQSIFTDKGQKIAVVFKANSLDEELRQLLINNKTILISFS